MQHPKDCNLQWLAVTNSVDQTVALQRFSADPILEHRIKVIEISKLLAGREGHEDGGDACVDYI